MRRWRVAFLGLVGSVLMLKWYDEVDDTLLERQVGRAVDNAGQVTKIRAQMVIVEEGRVDTGAMLNSLKNERVSSGPVEWSVEIRTGVPYAGFQHDGIGPVTPKKAKVLRFKPKGSAGYVFARRTKGFPGIFFLTEALERLDVDDFE